MIEFFPTWAIGVVLAVLGAAMGSFAGAQVWRLRARQLADDKAAKEPYDKAEFRRLKPLLGAKVSDDRSRCLHCGHQLAWFDLLPIVSWLSTRGKCRYCRRPIGKFELIIELSLAGFFVLSYLAWPFAVNDGVELSRFLVWLLAATALAVLFAYDAKWFLLPDAPMVIFIALSACFAALGVYQSGLSTDSLLSLLGAIVAIGGLYGALYAISAGKWVGYGDVTLGAGLGLLVGDWLLAVVAVVVANFVGTLLVTPGMLSGKLKRGTHIPFGPLLIIGAVSSFFWGRIIVDWYIGLL